MASVATTEAKNVELDLEKAVNQLSTSVRSNLDDVVGTVAQTAAGAVDSISESVVKGLRDLKAELNLSHMARSSPWGLVIGSLVGGAVFEYATSRIVFIRQSNDNNMLAHTTRPRPDYANPMLGHITKWGLRRILLK